MAVFVVFFVISASFSSKIILEENFNYFIFSSNSLTASSCSAHPAIFVIFNFVVYSCAVVFI